MQESDDGYARLASQGELEAAEIQSEAVMIFSPEKKAGGAITAEYSPIMVPQNGHFQTQLGCLDEDNTCPVVFELRSKLEDGFEVTLGTWPMMTGWSSHYNRC